MRVSQPHPVSIVGAYVDPLDMEQAIERVDRLARGARPSYVVTPNVDHLVRLQRSAAFRDVYRDAALVLADGAPVVWAARLLGTPLPAKVSGSDLFERYAELAARRGRRLFFLGGRPGAAEGAAEVLRERHPRLQVVGTHCPPYGFERDPALDQQAIQAVRDARPDVLFVGLGSPKQEEWARRHLELLEVPVVVCVGASFDFTSGQVQRAPRLLQRCGLEWAWRLAMEPRRLFRRYLVDDMSFFAYLAGQLLGRRQVDARRRAPADEGAAEAAPLRRAA